MNAEKYYDEISEMILKEKGYLEMLKGYCEAKEDISENIANLRIVLEDVLSLHEKVFDTFDNMVIDQHSLSE